MGSQSTSNIMQYAAYVQPNTGLPRVGHFDLANGTIQPLSFISGTPVTDLYQVIAAGASRIIPDGEVLAAKDVKLLPTISGRDIMAVGKNYMEHAKEFNSSGYDSSDKTDRPSHPVIFTKRATSIIAHGDVILPHAEFSQTLDYEGEIGVVVGKTGYRVSEADAWDYVWGYTIINDMTARERQRDHKQFFIGKSADTFCPIGPVAVSKDDLPSVLKVETHVNGELRQSSTTQDLIFSIPTLIKTISEGQTLQPGDVIATGTPAGVGIGLGTLTNKIGTAEILNSTVQRVSSSSPFQITNSAKTLGAGVGLAELNGKQLNYQRKGSGSDHIVFVHGLGGTLDYWTPLISKLSLAENNSLHLFDLEGHGLSPTHPFSKLSIESFALDIRSIFDAANITSSAPATLFAHSLGCLAALNFALDNPSLVGKLVLVGPPPSPSTGRSIQGSVCARGHRTSGHSKQMNPTAVAAVRLSLLGQDPESYAKATWALAGATQELKVEQIQAKTLIITGDEDKVSPPSLCEKYASRIQDAQVVVLNNVGHWHVFEDVGGVAQAVDKFL
ncbi:Fumarylacetoacetase-like, C-terminal domain superfamily [Fusarium oxysporum f. sp. vasinfectum]|nr:Fumarylacetoacetase-like, C-terminal domain superfamily [Fusarium oxysporum f. sp. vasinfectum]